MMTVHLWHLTAQEYFNLKQAQKSVIPEYALNQNRDSNYGLHIFLNEGLLAAQRTPSPERTTNEVTRDTETDKAMLNGSKYLYSTYIGPKSKDIGITLRPRYITYSYLDPFKWSRDLNCIQPSTR